MDMFKVLIIDDEPMIRKGLIKVVPWEKLDCCVCGEASDGVEGLEMITEYKPDILFADINMPEINGLDMIKEAKSIIPNCKFIILSGYREFTYMQEALRLGAFEYLLKPSNVEHICEVVKRAVMELKYQSDYQMEINKLRKNFEESIPILKEKLLYDVIYQININEEDINENFKLYGMDMSQFLMMVIELDGDIKQKEPYQRKLEQLGLIKTVEELFNDIYQVEKVILNNEQIAFVIYPIEGKPFIEESVHQKLGSIQSLIKSCFDFTVTIAISTLGKDVNELYHKFQECKKALSYRFYMGQGSIILYGDLSNFYQKQDEQSLFGGLDNELCNAIKTGNEEAVKKILDYIGEKVFSINMEPELIKTSYWNLIYEINLIQLSIKNAEKEENEIHNDISGVYKLIDQATQIRELQGLLWKVSIGVVERINEYNKKNINQILQNAIEYIKKNYSTSITLNELAEHTYVSSYYLSRMFKKELGKNFVEYLNEIRIEKAKELLKDNRYKTYEIAELVGIQDSHYFSKIFKKYVNMTPTEYKESQLMGKGLPL